MRVKQAILVTVGYGSIHSTCAPESVHFWTAAIGLCKPFYGWHSRRFPTRQRWMSRPGRSPESCRPLALRLRPARVDRVCLEEELLIANN